MIPFALLSGIIHSDENENFEIRIIEVAKDGFQFRTAEELNNVSSVTLYFYNEMEQLYKKVDILDPRIQKMEKGDFSVTYEVLIDNKNNQLADEYRDAVSNLLDQYYAYIKLKMDGDDAKLSNACNGYPSELDKVITTDFALQKRRWFKGASQYDAAELLRRSHIEYALELDNPLMYSNYMENSFIQFVKKYWKEHEASDFWIAKCKISRLYIGNQFCHNLFPDIDSLLKMMSKAKREHVKVTVVFTYLREE